MKKITFLLIAFLLPFLSNAQESTTPSIGSKEYLDFKHSYKDIKLSSLVTTLNATYLKKISDSPSSDGTESYTYNDPKLLNFGNDVTLKSIQLGTYYGKICDIYLIFNQSDGSKVKELFTNAYGAATDKPNQFMDKYIWLGAITSIYLTYEDSNLSAAIYTDTILNKIIKEKKAATASKAASDL